VLVGLRVGAGVEVRVGVGGTVGVELGGAVKDGVIIDGVVAEEVGLQPD